MAVKDQDHLYPTEALILKKFRKHYRIPVRSQHWQLRSLISAEKSNIVYFPGGSSCNHVQRLNTETHECETIKLLTFSPRCLVAEKGWVCCGGETGEFSAIPLDLAEGDGAEQDSTLGDVRSLASLAVLFRGRVGPGSKTLIAKSMKLAGDRVNCITLWFPPEDRALAEGAYEEPIAVLANNDKSVALVNLCDFHGSTKIEPFEVINYPDYVNRAVISPDGGLLVAILDDPFLYVHRRKEKHPEENRAFRSCQDVEYQWESCGQILLKSQRRDDSSDSRGSFAACFNSSGTLLAVGTQYGTISIFDTTLLGHPTVDPLLTSFQSSRPEEGPGAVRDMAFAPGPYDLLAWTEDRGHVGVADIRSNFISRQILDISADSEFEHISVLDRNTIDPRLLESRSESRVESLVPSLNAALAAAVDARRRQVQGEEAGRQETFSGASLTSEEAAALEDALRAQTRRLETETRRLEEETRRVEALRDEQRRRIERRSIRTTERPNGSSSLQLTWQDRAALRASTPRAGGADGPTAGIPVAPSRERSSSVSRAAGGSSGATRERASSVSRAIGDLLGSMREQREQRERTHESRIRNAQQLLQEVQARDRLATGRTEGGGGGSAGGTPSPAAAVTGAGTSSSSSAAAAAASVGLQRRSPATTTSRAAAGGARAGLTTGPWSDLEALYSLSFDNTPADNESARADRAAFLRHVYARTTDWDDVSTTMRRYQGVHDSPPQPDNTAGLSWSDDGRVLFVGAENGIYEFHVNIQSRKFVPSISMR